MKHWLKILLFSFFILGYSQANAGITFCDVIAATSDDSGKAGGEKKSDEEDEEPECD